MRATSWAEPGLALCHLAFDPNLLVILTDWQVTVRSLRDLAGRPWVAAPPGTACDHVYGARGRG